MFVTRKIGLPVTTGSPSALLRGDIGREGWHPGQEWEGTEGARVSSRVLGF